MALIPSILTIMAAVIGVFFFLEKITAKTEMPQAQRWLRNWTVKGVFVPVFLWTFFNSSVFSDIPALYIDLETVHGWPRFFMFCSVCAIGWFIIGTYWVGLTFFWLIGTLSRQPDLPPKFRSHMIIGSLVLLPVSFVILKACGWAFGGIALTAWSGTLAWLLVPIMHPERVKPNYNRAIVKIQFDRYEEAETEVLKELEKCEDDFDGWMMLADLYANHFNDLPGAARVIEESCHHPGATAPGIAAAYHQLADWYLKLENDPASARNALQQISVRFPQSHLAHMAEMRIKTLPATRAEWLEKITRKPIRLPSLGRHLDEAQQAAPAQVNKTDLALQANRCVDKLKENPNDSVVREQFARLLVEQLGKAQAGIDQLELLLDHSGQTEEKRAEWMTLMAAWHLRYRQDAATGKKILQRLIRDYPQTSFGFAAQRRLSLLETEERMQRQKRNFPPSPPKADTPLPVQGV